MTISIGSTVLSDDLVWTNQFDYSAIAQTVHSCLGGGSVIQQLAITTQGREIVLLAYSTGGKISGYFTYAQIQELKVLEAAGNTITFVYESFSINVIIKTNGIQVSPVIARPNPDAVDWYIGTITMIEV